MSTNSLSIMSIWTTDYHRQNMIKYDIAIVGRRASRLIQLHTMHCGAAVKVILLEKDESIAHNIRTSGVTWIEEIEKLEISKEYYNPIKNYSFISPSNEITIKRELCYKLRAERTKRISAPCYFSSRGRCRYHDKSKCY